MREKLEKSVRSIFSITLIIAILGGGVIFFMFIVALIMGGTLGESLATNASKIIMPYFIRFASISVLAGLVSFYITGEHTLSLNEEEKQTTQ
ncbi:MAG: hypothetical protein AB2375_05665 [Tissierellaceae bacterium]